MEMKKQFAKRDDVTQELEESFTRGWFRRLYQQRRRKPGRCVEIEKQQRRYSIHVTELGKRFDMKSVEEAIIEHTIKSHQE